ncbi:hypothetical protein DIPPA_63176 [Diplonema papillatum]|nr:hypothetical protein DIPPA_63176 [Diplonema papillatum]
MNILNSSAGNRSCSAGSACSCTDSSREEAVGNGSHLGIKTTPSEACLSEMSPTFSTSCCSTCSMSTYAHGTRSLCSSPSSSMPSSVPTSSRTEEGLLKLYTHNVFFLPFIARLATSGICALLRDHYRAEWISDNILKENYELVCLQEMFRREPRELVEKMLKAGGYHVLSDFHPHTDGWTGRSLILTNSGLFFASKHPIVHHDFIEYSSACWDTADFLARKGAACVVVKLPNGKYAAVFFTHTQAEVSGDSVRRKQLSQCLLWIAAKVDYLTRAVGIPLKDLAVLLAGDLNVDGRVVNGQLTCNEFSTLMQDMHSPCDVLRLARGQDIEGLLTHAEGRLDHIFSWNVKHAAEVSVKEEQSPFALDGNPAYETNQAQRHEKGADAAAFLGCSKTNLAVVVLCLSLLLALVSSLTGVGDLLMGIGLSTLFVVPVNKWLQKPTFPSANLPSSHPSSPASPQMSKLLEHSSPLTVHDCATFEGWTSSAGEPVSDHRPIVLTFSL